MTHALRQGGLKLLRRRMPPFGPMKTRPFGPGAE